jgi:NADPH2:quinone reductase
MKAIRIHGHGGAEALRLEDVEVPVTAPGHVRVRMSAVGVNFIEVYQRTGAYAVTLPATPGSEGAGEVVEVGEGVTHLTVGDRVASVNFLGAYAEEALVRADRTVKVPPGLDLDVAAAAMLQGMTANYLCHDTFALQREQTCLVHAAAGGVGLLLIQMAKRRGARVLGTVSSEEKAALAREAGADEVIIYTREDFAAAVRRITGDGAHVVYDSVGKATFDGSLESLRARGTLVLFGQSSGSVPPFEISRLAKGSFALTRPTLGHYVATRSELEGRAAAVLESIMERNLGVRIDRRLPLEDASEAHRLLESRQTMGKVLLVP